MAKIVQIRGALLEEAVLFLLEKVGYRIVYKPTDSIDPSDINAGHSGLELRGRGSWHQIDAIAEQSHTPAFIYPLRLIVEAKFYTSKTVGIEVVRNAVGVIKDVSENYFTIHKGSSTVGTQRFNYQSAVFGVSGFSPRAVEYAIAHQIFLIEYRNIPVIEPVIDAIRNINEDCLTPEGLGNIAGVREVLKQALANSRPINTPKLFTQEGIDIINRRVAQALREIGGSYFGMLQGRWPLHLLTQNPLPAYAFREDVVKCRLQGERNGSWRFTPSEIGPNSENWFELQFFLPPELALLVAEKWNDPLLVAQTKEQNFSFITLSGKIGEIWRSVRLELDRGWLQRYIDNMDRS